MGHLGDVAADYLGLPHEGTPPKLYHNSHDGTFTDVTEAAKLNHVLLTMGCNFGDLDNDGWLDVYVVQGGLFPPDPKSRHSGDKLFHNRGDGTFEDITEKSGIAAIPGGYGHGVAVGD